MPSHRKKHKPRVLFLVKRKNDSAGYSSFESGLHNSCRLLLDALLRHGLVCDGKVVVCVDANSIDREITQSKPDICFLDAIWVTPKKLIEIQKIHRRVRFVIRVHSNIPFLATEGNAIGWLKEYELINNTTVSFNNARTAAYFSGVLDRPTYLPNIYESQFEDSNAIDGILHIGCFGAIRPLKNQLIQAFAAIHFANSIHRVLHFHINSQRIEQHGEGIVKNIRSLFEKTNHVLIEHPWLKHDDFISLIKTIDVGLQVSFTESFNIIAGDFIYSGVPIIVSHDIDWMTSKLQVDTNNVFTISDKINDVLRDKKLYLRRARKSLKEYNENAIEVWGNYLR